MESRDNSALLHRAVAGRDTTGSGSSVLSFAGRRVVTQKTSGESRTEPTAAMLARKRKTSPILRIISAKVGEDGQGEWL